MQHFLQKQLKEGKERKKCENITNIKKNPIH